MADHGAPEKVLPRGILRGRRKLGDLEITDVVFSFEFFRSAHAGFAGVDADDLRRRPAQRVPGRLRRSAAFLRTHL